MTTTTTMTLTQITKTVLIKDVLSIIEDYKTSYELFEQHQEVTQKLREQFGFIKKVILDNEENKNENIVKCDYGDYILEWIEDEKKAAYENDFFEVFEIDYGLDEDVCDGNNHYSSNYNEMSGECYCSNCN